MSSAEAHSWWDDDPHSSDDLRDAASRSARERAVRVTGDGRGSTGERTLSRAHAAGFADAFDLDGAFGAPRRRFARDTEVAADGARVIVLERSPAYEGDERPTRGRSSTVVLTRDPEAVPAAAPRQRRSSDTDDFAALSEPAAPRRRRSADTDDFAALSEPAAAPAPRQRRSADTDDFAAVAEAPYSIGEDPGARRTVRISGRPGERVTPRTLREIQPRRQRTSTVERAVSRPDRIAMYVVLLGLFLVVLAAASGGAH